jgi:hypothetical protein
LRAVGLICFIHKKKPVPPVTEGRASVLP